MLFKGVFIFFVKNHKELEFARTTFLTYFCFEGKKIILLIVISSKRLPGPLRRIRQQFYSPPPISFCKKMIRPQVDLADLSSITYGKSFFPSRINKSDCPFWHPPSNKSFYPVPSRAHARGVCWSVCCNNIYQLERREVEKDRLVCSLLSFYSCFYYYYRISSICIHQR